jgi:hypothetical protein
MMVEDDIWYDGGGRHLSRPGVHPRPQNFGTRPVGTRSVKKCIVRFVEQRTALAGALEGATHAPHTRTRAAAAQGDRETWRQGDRETKT